MFFNILKLSINAAQLVYLLIHPIWAFVFNYSGEHKQKKWREVQAIVNQVLRRFNSQMRQINCETLVIRITFTVTSNTITLTI